VSLACSVRVKTHRPPDPLRSDGPGTSGPRSAAPGDALANARQTTTGEKNSDTPLVLNDPRSPLGNKLPMFNEHVQSMSYQRPDVLTRSAIAGSRV